MKIEFLSFSSSAITPAQGTKDLPGFDFVWLPVSVTFFNFSDKSVQIEKGNRFCQIVFHKIATHPVLREVDKFQDKTDRGEGSFGSTNKKQVCRQDLC